MSACWENHVLNNKCLLGQWNLWWKWRVQNWKFRYSCIPTNVSVWPRILSSTLFCRCVVRWKWTNYNFVNTFYTVKQIENDGLYLHEFSIITSCIEWFWWPTILWACKIGENEAQLTEKWDAKRSERETLNQHFDHNLSLSDVILGSDLNWVNFIFLGIVSVALQQYMLFKLLGYVATLMHDLVAHYKFIEQHLWCCGESELFFLLVILSSAEYHSF